jgi:hypothetical protein
MNIKSRIKIYTGKEVKDRTVIVGEPAALRALAKTLTTAANSPSGFDAINLYEPSGHDFEIVVVCDITEDEWQNMPAKSGDLSCIQIYDDLRTSLNKNKERVV